jgi:hypothetical protein
MKSLGTWAAAVLILSTIPALSETNTQGQQNQQTSPGGAGVSQAGVPGKQGSKSGPSPTVAVGQGAAVRAPGGIDTKSGPNAQETTGSTATRQQDVSGVKGMAGNKSGPAPQRPGK